MTADRLARLWLVVAGVSGALAVGFAAYASHGLADAPQAAEWVDKASRYQIYHALALLWVAGRQSDGERWAAVAGLLFTAGIVLFCGTLYVMALTGLAIGRVAPFGGTSFILGWLAVAAGAIAGRRR